VRPLSGRGVALLIGPLVGLLVAQAIDRSGPNHIAAALGVAIGGAILLSLSRRLHLTLLPVTLILPLAGYLTIVWPAQGFTLLFDLAVMGPFLLLCLRKLECPDAIRLLDRRWWPVWAFVLVVLLQAVNPEGVSWLVNLQGFRRNVLPMLLFFVVVNVDLSRPQLLHRMAWLSMAVAAVVAVWGLKQRFGGLTPAEQVHAATVGTLWLAGGGNELRIFSTLRVPWALGVYAATMGLVAISLALNARTWIGRFAACAMALLLAVTVAFTLMRAVMVGYILGLMLLVATGVARRGRRAVPATLVLLVGVLALGAAAALSSMSVLGEWDSVIVQRFLTLAAPLSDYAVHERFSTWQGAKDIVLHHPLGLGLGTTSGISARYEELLQSAPIHADNLYIAAFVETGWLGGALLLILTAWTFVRGRHALHPVRSPDVWLAAGILGGLLASTVANFATPVLWEAGSSQLHWLMLGAICSLADRCPCLRRTPRFPVTEPRVAGPS
jgi:O-antigen ligase